MKEILETGLKVLGLLLLILLGVAAIIGVILIPSLVVTWVWN